MLKITPNYRRNGHLNFNEYFLRFVGVSTADYYLVDIDQTNRKRAEVLISKLNPLVSSRDSAFQPREPQPGPWHISAYGYLIWVFATIILGIIFVYFAFRINPGILTSKAFSYAVITAAIAAAGYFCYKKLTSR